MKVGDRVSVLDDPISGIILKIEGDEIFINTDDGFEMSFTRNELVVENSAVSIVPSIAEITGAVREKEHFKKKTKKPLLVTKKKEIPAMEVDLHIHKLVKSYKGMSNFDMLSLQLETAKRQLQFAIEKRIPRVIFIHGVGEGVLKEELRFEFSKYDGIKVSDGDYSKYGLGAMEIYIFQNPNRN